jgi:mannan endo-1,6-alpha-mannosidase
MTEQSCESVNTCNTDQLSFRSYFASWLASTATLAPFTYPTIAPLMASTAKAAAAICNAGSSGTQCGHKWTTGTNDGSFGVGQQMSALSAIQSAMIQIPGVKTIAPVTVNTGGTSQGNPSAGLPADSQAALLTPAPATKSGKIGASILTFLILSGVMGGSAFMVLDV